MVGQVIRLPQASAPNPSDGEIWRLSRTRELDDAETERFLTLAAAADRRLDEDDQALVAEWLAHDPFLNTDIAAAGTSTDGPGEAVAETILARAIALVPEKYDGNVIALQPRVRAVRAVGEWAGWGSFVAAMAVASWLGFTLGVDTSRSLSPTEQSAEDGLHELLDPSSNFLRELNDGAQT
ncbi:MAG: hypothetical protein QOC72_4050 [Methylobacteriaceae bacterium]|jgi:hypothetical protein|nr:hypothetical protein [Methylobacteriaceae bacterium]